MKKSRIYATILIILIGVTVTSFVGWFILKPAPYIMQGEVMATSYKISSQMAGRVDSLPVRKGETVNKGELLCVIKSKTVGTKLTQAEAQRTALEAQNIKVDRGTRSQVKAQAYQSLQQARAGLELARQTHTRIKNLHASGVVSSQKYDEAFTALRSAMAIEAMAAQGYSLACQGAQWEDKSTAKALVGGASGAVAEVESYITDGWQYSPVDGIVSSVMAERGELVGAGFPVITIIDLNDSWVVFNVKETLLPKIKVGKKLTGYFPALDRNIQLTISDISAEASYSTWAATRTSGEFDIRTFAVEARADRPIKDLRTGMSVIVDYNSL